MPKGTAPAGGRHLFACLIHAMEGSSGLWGIVKLFGIISPKLTMSKCRTRDMKGLVKSYTAGWGS